MRCDLVVFVLEMRQDHVCDVMSNGVDYLCRRHLLIAEAAGTFGFFWAHVQDGACLADFIVLRLYELTFYLVDYALLFDLFGQKFMDEIPNHRSVWLASRHLTLQANVVQNKSSSGLGEALRLYICRT